ncbi:type II secretion system F family protein [Georgenia faecalis]|uniref:Type II secretion system F family protein n=1 Tax=Georgenia faecalis TaxID=2483799 RepID=A0ABV9D4R2_9MICO|nr:type II secretion protein F [Georgenia faecalis]
MSALTAAVGLLCLAVLVRAPLRRPRIGEGLRGPRAGVLARAGTADALPRGRLARLRHALPRRRHSALPDVGVLVTEVATRLRSGASVDAAWGATLARAGLDLADTARAGPDADGVPRALTDLAARAGPRSDDRAAVAAVVVACRLSHELGAPLADVLDRCAHGITEATAAAGARRVALAGPASTARILGWLPVVGLLLGSSLGADPLTTLRDGAWGSACLVAGGALLLVGRRWTAALVAAAERGSRR